MNPCSTVLNGTSYENAKSFGAPHFMARYTGSGYGSYKRDPDAVCFVCGRPATETHHAPYRDYFALRTKWGTFVLKPALVALCRECHEDIEHSRKHLVWVWNSDEIERMWWSGYILSHGYKPHSEHLYKLGRWTVR